MHAVARLVFHGLIDNIQASWVKMGRQGIEACLDAGVNDLGGTLMNESITRAAGSSHGQEWSPDIMQSRIHSAGRRPKVRTTLYGAVPSDRTDAAALGPQLIHVENAGAAKQQRSKRLKLKTDDSMRFAHFVSPIDQAVLMAACN